MATVEIPTGLQQGSFRQSRQPADESALSNDPHSMMLPTGSSPGRGDMILLARNCQTVVGMHGNSKQHKGLEYTKDGIVDRMGQPAIRAQTGSWKSSAFVFGSSPFAHACFPALTMQLLWTWYPAGQSGCNVLAYWSIGKNLVVFLSNVMHKDNISAANIYSNWSGVSFMTPVLGGFLADTYIGRFWCNVVFTVIYLIGMVLITLSVAIPSLHPPQCLAKDFTCQQASTLQMGVFNLAIFTIAVGSGAAQCPATAFGADQFDEEHPKEKQQKSSFFNWLFQSLTFGYILASTIFVYLQVHLSWKLGYVISTIVLLVGLISFVLGMPFYRYHKLHGNPATIIAQVVVAAWRKRGVQHSSTDLLFEIPDGEGGHNFRKILHTAQFTFLDKAAVERTGDRIGGLKIGAWSLCPVTQVEEVKALIRVIPVFVFTLFYSTVYIQLSTFFVEQGLTMDLSLGSGFKIPAASLSIFEGLSIMICVVLYDKFFVPFARNRTGHPRGITDLQRIGIGLAITIFCMIIAMLVEIKRLHLAKIYGLLDSTSEPIPMTVFWEVPQYFLIGLSEVFSYIGQMEFFYDQAPDRLRTIGTSLSYLSIALGSFLSTFLVTAVTNITSNNGKTLGWMPDNLNRGRLHYFYLLCAILSLVNLALFVWAARCYKYLKQESPSPSIPEITKTSFVDTIMTI